MVKRRRVMKWAKSINVKLDDQYLRYFMVVKENMGVWHDSEVVRKLIREAYFAIPEEERKRIEREVLGI